jgi:hypothetical protein
VTTIIARLTERLAVTSARHQINFKVLQIEFYRRQAAFCHELATKAQAAGALFSQLLALATSYEEKAKEMELKPRTPLVKNEWG